MAETAATQLRRILAVIPALADGEEHSLSEVASRVNVAPRTLLKDLQSLAIRFDEPGGFVEGLQLYIEADRVSAVTNHFLRPMRLTLQELHALDLGLSMLRLERPPHEHGTIERARDRLQKAMVYIPAGDLRDGVRVAELPVDGHQEHLSTLRDALSARHKVELTYRRASSPEPSTRTICPYAFVVASGMWYLIAYCETVASVRVFRLDRVVEVNALENAFEVPPTFAVTEYMAEGRVFHHPEPRRMRVRYSAGIARWIAERERVELDADGSVTIDHPLADEDWGVRHVLQYGAEAEVLDPPDMREAVRDRLET
ncbi:MAG: WYL domain-containing protein, partial [Gemmatimonadaceae bacterium]